MHEVRVESLDKLESLGGEVWISANSGEGGVNIIFPKNVWDDLLSKASETNEPTEAELGEWNSLSHRLASFAKEHSFETILEDVPCGDSGELSYDLVLRSNDLYAVTTGYFFATTIEARIAEKLRYALEADSFVEQAYAIGAVADDGAFAFGDDDLKIMSIRGRKSTASRFEMAPELWRTLSEKLGWTSMETVIPDNKHKG